MSYETQIPLRQENISSLKLKVQDFLPLGKEINATNSVYEN
jgi:hypothetical protein